MDLARAFPDTQIVLDHVGGPIGLGPYAGKRDEVFAGWSARIRELASCPNVHIKLGGLGMRMFGFTHHLGELPPSSQELAAARAAGCRDLHLRGHPIDGPGRSGDGCSQLADGPHAPQAKRA